MNGVTSDLHCLTEHLMHEADEVVGRSVGKMKQWLPCGVSHCLRIGT